MVQEMIDFLTAADPEIGACVSAELARQRRNIELIASENIVSEAVLAAMGTVLTNKYAEGYPGKRYYGGCQEVDVAENIARDRACRLFGADHANVQPHSGAQANFAVYQALCDHGDTVLGMDLANGGHLTHGSPVNFSGKNYHMISYGLNEKGYIDYDQVRDLARKEKPKMIIAGASAYPRIIDFKAFADIAHEVGAYLFVDMAHIAGLVAAGLHPSPVPYADVVTTTTHKTLRGPRGGMILCKEELAKKIDSAIFPGSQGGPLLHIIAAKAVALGEALKPEFKDYQRRILENAAALAESLTAAGFDLVSGGTDNHLMLVDLRKARHHRQGAGAPPGRGPHHRQQKRHPQRPGEALCHQRHPGGHPRRHHPGLRGGGDEGHRRAHLADRHRLRRQGRRHPGDGGCHVRQVPPVRLNLQFFSGLTAGRPFWAGPLFFSFVGETTYKGPPG